MSTSSKVSKFLSLRELHLTPHFIYLIDQHQFEPTNQYALQIWKDQVKIGKTNELTKLNPNGQMKYGSLEFNKIRFVFDVQALFQQSAQASITLKLTQKSFSPQNEVIKDEFHLHILYYSYQFSKDRFVRHKENSIGKLNNWIFNYSFSSLYGEKLDSLLFRKHQKREVLLEDLNLTKKDSKYGILVNDQNKKDYDTIFIIQAVAQKGAYQIQTPTNNPQKISKIQTSKFYEDEDLDNIRHAARSIIEEVATLRHSDSNLTEKDIIQQIKFKSQTIVNLFFILIGCYLIYSLMHPNAKK